MPADARPLYSEEIEYIQHIDVALFHTGQKRRSRGLYQQLARRHAQQALQRINAVTEFDGDKQVLQKLVENLTQPSDSRA